MPANGPSYIQVFSKSEIERSIAQLYAAGLELQSASAKRAVAPQRRAAISGQVKRIGTLIENIRTEAERSSIHPD